MGSSFVTGRAGAMPAAALGDCKEGAAREGGSSQTGTNPAISGAVKSLCASTNRGASERAGSRPLRIAQVAPLYEPVPPRLYGGTERVVSHLTEELVAQGHTVTLFASGDSVTAAELVPVTPRALRLDRSCRDPLAHHVVQLEKLLQRASDFDVIHFHVDYMHYPMSRRAGVPHVTTLHGRLDLPDLEAVYREFRDTPVVSISNAQREPLPHAAWEETIHHGLPLDLFGPGRGEEGYLAFLGRISPEKRVDRAIEIARRAGRKLRIAAKVDRVDIAYFENQIRPLLALPHVEYIGEITDEEKGDFLGAAAALLFPIDWPEPFGLVIIESLACGTPVVAFDEGSVPEILEDGVTGFLVQSNHEAVAALGKLSSLDRVRCRRAFEDRFTAARMAASYVEIYDRIIRRSRPLAAAGGSAA
jgi:glycosyltransferase involved in cell wall biosynthesis